MIHIITGTIIGFIIGNLTTITLYDKIVYKKNINIIPLIAVVTFSIFGTSSGFLFGVKCIMNTNYSF